MFFISGSSRSCSRRLALFSAGASRVIIAFLVTSRGLGRGMPSLMTSPIPPAGISRSNEWPVYSASLWQVRQPVYGHSVGRWRHYERHLQPLFDVLGQSADAGTRGSGSLSPRAGRGD